MTLTPYRKVNVVDAEGNLVSFGGGGGGGGGDASAANQLAEIERLEEIRDRLTPPLIQLALVSRSATGDATLIAAQASKKIRVYSFVIKLLGAAENIVLVKDGTTTIDQHALIGITSSKQYAIYFQFSRQDSFNSLLMTHAFLPQLPICKA